MTNYKFISNLPFLFCFTIMIFCSFECDSLKKSQKNSVEMDNFSSTKLWTNYMINFPSSYKVEEGKGDDSVYFKFVKDDDSIIIGYESRSHSLDRSNIKNLSEIKTEFINIENINNPNSLKFLLVYNLDPNASFRNLFGKIYLFDNREYIQFLSFDSSDKWLDEIKLMVSSIKKITIKN